MKYWAMEGYILRYDKHLFKYILNEIDLSSSVSIFRLIYFGFLSLTQTSSCQRVSGVTVNGELN
jgi:hypothetical protein